MSVIRVGIIGAGSIGAIHARALHHVEGATVTAFSGGSTSVMADCGWPDAVQLSVADVIAHPEVDVVAVCSPSGTHAELALLIAAAGKHALVEKPIALTAADARSIADAQDENGVVIAMVAQRRFEPEIAAVKKLLDAGRLGEIRLASTQVHWMRDDEYYAAAEWRREAPGGGSLMNQGVHNVDLLLWLCGSASEVTAQSATLAHDIDVEDTTVATVRFASGALGIISTSTATPPGSPSVLTLHTSLGVVEIGQGALTRWEIPGIDAPDVAGSSASGATDPGAIGHIGHAAAWQELTDAIAEGRKSEIGAHEAARTVSLLSAINDAAATGRRVFVEDAL